MKTVQDLLSAKGDAVWSIAPDQTVYDAIALMSEKNVGALMVVENGELKGIVTERDYAREVVLRDRSSRTTKVSEIMTGNVTSVTPKQGIDDCMLLMTEKRFRHLPVVDQGKLVGVLSMPDLVRAVVEEQQYVIDQLENYISH